jgi:hypothetical protein
MRGSSKQCTRASAYGSAIDRALLRRIAASTQARCNGKDRYGSEHFLHGNSHPILRFWKKPQASAKVKLTSENAVYLGLLEALSPHRINAR